MAKQNTGQNQATTNSKESPVITPTEWCLLVSSQFITLISSNRVHSFFTRTRIRPDVGSFDNEFPSRTKRVRLYQGVDHISSVLKHQKGCGDHLCGAN